MVGHESVRVLKVYLKFGEHLTQEQIGKMFGNVRYMESGIDKEGKYIFLLTTGKVEIDSSRLQAIDHIVGEPPWPESQRGEKVFYC